MDMSPVDVMYRPDPVSPLKEYEGADTLPSGAINGNPVTASAPLTTTKFADATVFDVSDKFMFIYKTVLFSR
jgi:hypothetical protein